MVSHRLGTETIEAPVAADGRSRWAGGFRGSFVGAEGAARLVVAGVALYVVIDIALVFLRPRFSILHNAESDYGSRGSWAWLMDLNFLLRCFLSLAAVRAVVLVFKGSAVSRRLRLGLWLLAIWAVGSGLLAFFPDDPVGTRTQGSGRVHLALAFIAFAAILVGARVVSSAVRVLPRWQSPASPLTVLSWGAVIPLVLLGHAHFRVNSLGGLYEKIFLAVELVWLLVLVAPLLARRLPGGSVAGGSVAGAPVAGGPVAGGPVAGGPGQSPRL